MTPLFLPIPPHDLDRIIREEWAGTPGATDGSERGVARLAGFDPDRGFAAAGDDGLLHLCWLTTAEYVTGEERAASRRALLSLADALEDRGLVVDREGGGIRVVGWAAARCDTCNGHGRIDARSGEPDVAGEPCDDCGSLGLVRIASLPPFDSRAASHFSAVLSARLARAEAGRAKPGEPGTEHKGEMMARRMRG